MYEKVLKKIKETKWKYALSHSSVRVQGKMIINHNVLIKNSRIYIDSTSSLILHDGVRLDGIGLYITNGGTVEIGEYSFFEKGNNASTPEYIVNNGNLHVADHSKLACQRLWIRFGGVMSIGQYTNINAGSEIRADEKVVIGNYCRLSYNLRIWDTNTHNIYSPEKRRQLTHDKFPSFGYEYERPKTAPVIIGDGAWLGEKVSILKGTTLGENVTVGYNTTIIGKYIPDNRTIVQKVELQII